MAMKRGRSAGNIVMRASILIAAVIFTAALPFAWAQDKTETDGGDFPFPEQGDFRDLGWSEAFFGMHDFFSRSYAFGEWKGIPWDSLAARHGRSVVEAERAGDRDAYRIAVLEYIREIPDGHVKVACDYSDLEKRFTGGSLGLGLARLDDGRIIAAAVRPDGPAGAAGIPAGSRIVSWNGAPVESALPAADTRWFKSAATRAHLELQRLQAITRAPVGTRIRVGYEPTASTCGEGEEGAENVEAGQTGEAAVRTAELVAMDDGYADLALFDLAPIAPMEEYRESVTWRMLDGGIGYLRILLILDMDDMTRYPAAIVEKVTQAIREFTEAGAKSMILDLRGNRGGADQVAAEISGFFATERAFYESTEWYDAETGRFEPAHSDLFMQTFKLGDKPIYVEPAEPHFGGRVAVLVNPATVSSGEGLALAIGAMPEAEVIGFNGTHGSFGLMSWPVGLPEGIVFMFSLGRSVDEGGVIQIDSDACGSGGVQPDVRIPLTFENAMAYASGKDVELEFAIDLLKE